MNMCVFLFPLFSPQNNISIIPDINLIFFWLLAITAKYLLSNKNLDLLFVFR